MSNLKPILNNLSLWAMVSLTLGLAPFQPEPHGVGKIQGGAGRSRRHDRYGLV